MHVSRCSKATLQYLSLLTCNELALLSPPDCQSVAEERLQVLHCRSDATSLSAQLLGAAAVPAAAEEACQGSQDQRLAAGSQQPHPAYHKTQDEPGT